MRAVLKKLGLSDKEIDVYLAGLQLGPATVQDLAKFSHNKRPTVYVILDRLKTLNLANESFKGEKKLFEMAEPAKLFKLIDKEKRETDEKEKALAEAISGLEAIMKKSEFAMDAKIYEGFDAVKEIFADLAKIEGVTYTICSSSFYNKLDIGWFVKNVTRMREKMKNKSYIISDPNSLVVKFYLMEDTDIREFRFLPNDMVLPSIIQINEDMIYLISMSEPYSCLVMKNKTIAKTMKFLFNLIWHSLDGKNLPTKEQVDDARKIQLK